MKSRGRSLAVSVITTLSAIAAVGPAVRADDWPTYQHDLQHTGYAPVAPDPRTLQLSWSAPTGYAAPLIVGDNVIAMKNQQGVGSDTTRITSFRLADGGVNWTTTGKYVFPGQPSYAGGLVVYSAEEQATNSTKLFVLDAATGALKYSVPSISSVDTEPALYRNPVTNKLTAYVASHQSVQAIDLGPTSGTVLWTASGSFGGQSAPTIAGNSVVLAGPGQFYAFDLASGASNHFHAGGISGGGGTTVAYDAGRSQFYVMEDYDTSVGTVLTAYHYNSNASITQVWQKGGAGISGGGSVAIGPDGKVYSVDNATLVERDPDTGAILRSLAGQQFANAVAPMIGGGYLWGMGGSDTPVYDLATFTKVKSFPGSRGSLNSAYDSPGALDATHFLLDYGNIYNSPGFNVYATVPEPGTSLVLAGIALPAMLGRRRVRAHRG